MGTMCWLLLLGAAVTIIGAPSNDRPRTRKTNAGPTWFDVLAQMQARR
jgi:hypothetical protein